MVGWNKYVENYRMQSIFWHNIWKKCGSPLVGYVADIRKKMRNKYHLAINWIKKYQDKIIRDNVAKFLMSYDSKLFWNNKLKINNNNNKACVNKIDGERGVGACNVFRNKYKTLYNENSSCLDDILLNFNQDINNKCSFIPGNNGEHLHQVTYSMLNKAIAKL